MDIPHDPQEVRKLDRSLSFDLVETAWVAILMGKNYDALDRRHLNLIDLRPDQRREHLGVLANLVGRRRAEIVAFTVPKPTPIFDPTTDMLQIRQYDPIVADENKVDLSILPASTLLPHDEVRKTLPASGQNPAHFFEALHLGGMGALRKKEFNFHFDPALLLV
jgi:hypothetical protein